MSDRMSVNRRNNPSWSSWRAGGAHRLMPMNNAMAPLRHHSKPVPHTQPIHNNPTRSLPQAPTHTQLRACRAVFPTQRHINKRLRAPLCRTHIWHTCEHDACASRGLYVHDVHAGNSVAPCTHSLWAVPSQQPPLRRHSNVDPPQNVSELGKKLRLGQRVRSDISTKMCPSPCLCDSRRADRRSPRRRLCGPTRGPLPHSGQTPRRVYHKGKRARGGLCEKLWRGAARCGQCACGEASRDVRTHNEPLQTPGRAGQSTCPPSSWKPDCATAAGMQRWAKRRHAREDNVRARGKWSLAWRGLQNPPTTPARTLLRWSASSASVEQHQSMRESGVGGVARRAAKGVRGIGDGR